ncbi:MAG: alpha/beta hydrolase [Proteobacteria bacterium]|nr:alpha/beta hydrolase [Pseudomonadota bacterium]
MSSKTKICFNSGNIQCAGWFYQAVNKSKAPCVMLGHGFAAIKELRLEAYAERFQQAGYHVLVFDYRHFGASEGSPRQVLSIAKQHNDWQAAIDHARTLDEVDRDKIILWGTSFSGGHVVPVAVKDGAIAAVISQAPFMNGPATLRVIGTPRAARLAMYAVVDLARSLFKLSPLYVDAVGEPGTFAAMTAPGEAVALRKLYPKNMQVNEKVAARIFLSMGLYSPDKTVSKLNVPWLVQVAENDLTAPPMSAIKAAEKAEKGELITYDTGHFDVYIPPIFETIVEDQLNFIRRHVE